MAMRQATLSRQALLASGALRAYLRPKLAADAKLDLTSILQSVTAANWQAQKPKIKTALDQALVGKLAKDAEICDVIDILEELDDVVDKEDEEIASDAEPDDDDDDEEKKRKAKEGAEKLKEAAEDEKDDDDDDKKSASDEKDDDDDDDEKRRMPPKAEDESDDDDDKKRTSDRKGARDRKGAQDRKRASDKAKGMDGMITKAAMDAAIAASVAKATKDAETATIARLHAIHEAREDVRPIVGAIVGAMDSAASVYKVGLEGLAAQGFAVDTATLPPDNYGMVFKALKPSAVAAMDVKPSASTKAARVALDSTGISRRNEMFPNAHRLLAN